MDYSDEEDGYSDDGDMGSEGYYNDDYDGDSDDGSFAEEDPGDRLIPREQNYKILSEDDIQRLEQEDVRKLSHTLCISSGDSCVLLVRNNWDANKVHDEWFADEEKVRKSAGLLLQNPVGIVDIAEKEVNCPICFEMWPVGEMINAASCRHRHCVGCWRSYISTSINSDGPGCLDLRCPDPSCKAAVSKDVVDALVSQEDREKYSRFLVRSYIEGNKKAKWCPGPGCDFAVIFHGGGGSSRSADSEVSCRCGHAFCWNCGEDAHRPVPCETVAEWVLKNSSESENTNWILANSKPCPKCRRAIEKNQGCMHMTCTPPCNFQFCWLCLGGWSEHQGQSFYDCNKYVEAKESGAYSEEESIRERAKNSIERYTHYYERWATNKSSTKKAIADLQSMHKKVDKLRDKVSMSHGELNFVIEAWEQVVECRRVLTWSYAYGYYLDPEGKAKKELFEYLQGEAEAGLERLHQSAETDLQAYMADNVDEIVGEDLKKFLDFREKLARLTSVTRNYFENLVGALEIGLKEVDSTVSSQLNKKEEEIIETSVDYDDE
ncbi:uncharacterized protein A4U43_C01F36230 [Asparagus officinalis]|uniref:RBR-type E3 ubiquitin transferase n=1 Tax=Asparagus officinalis TaxID=4686 RepID=A0A5P1FXW9_ASPOF|nr:probable E3 ubiquitin-protein ligase ARI8 [Asparagus officinalis]ONK82111.1 uncharacterized protein A4U43_C01F36230 [Asparagus officinalis]